jgi:hypothetical protein
MVNQIQNVEQLKPGHVIRAYNSDGTLEPFSDCVILKVNKEWNHITFARPYLFASSTDTMCVTPLTGVETVRDVSFERLASRYVQVCNERGEPCVYDVTR